MKKVISVFMFIFVTVVVFAQPAYNPWTRHWIFDIDGDIRNFRFDREHHAVDLDTGVVHYYAWTSKYELAIADFYGKDKDIWMKPDFGDDDTTCTLMVYEIDYENNKLIPTDHIVKAWTTY